MKKILVAYASKYGSTKEVAERIASELRTMSYELDVRQLKDVNSPKSYDAVVVGAALYMYKWHKDARKFLSKFQAELSKRPVAVFALGPVKDPIDKKEWQNSDEQLTKALKEFSWFKPVDIKLFGGKFEPKTLGFFMKMFAGKEPASDIRDWKEISSWAREVGKQFK